MKEYKHAFEGQMNQNLDILFLSLKYKLNIHKNRRD